MLHSNSTAEIRHNIHSVPQDFILDKQFGRRNRRQSMEPPKIETSAAPSAQPGSSGVPLSSDVILQINTTVEQRLEKSGATLKQIQDVVDERVEKAERDYRRLFIIASSIGSIAIVVLGVFLAGVTYLQVSNHAVAELHEKAAKDILADMRIIETNAEIAFRSIQNKMESLATNRVVSYDKDGKLRLTPIDGTIWLKSAQDSNWNATCPFGKAA